MRFASILIALCALALVAVAALPAGASTAPAGWAGLVTASPAFLQQGGAAWTPGPAGGTSRSHLPNSTLPSTFTQCSVDASDAAPCSASDPAGPKECSAHCDGGQICSALVATAGPNPQVECSTLGGKARCSVLQPPLNIDDSFCSAANSIIGQSSRCSVLAEGKKAACTAANPARTFFNFCSALESGGARVQCSVLGSGQNLTGYCSVGFQANATNPKLCSSFSDLALCSVVLGQRGVCSAIKKAPTGTCSAHTPSAYCSVMGGQPGLLCRWP